MVEKVTEICSRCVCVVPGKQIKPSGLPPESAAAFSSSQHNSHAVELLFSIDKPNTILHEYRVAVVENNRMTTLLLHCVLVT